MLFILEENKEKKRPKEKTSIFPESSAPPIFVASSPLLSSLSFGMSRQPEVLWAQRSDRVYLTVALPDAKDVSVKCEPQGLFSFSANGSHAQSYQFTLQLYAPILPQSCKTKCGLRNILCSIQKEQKGWWKRLLKSEEKPPPYLKVDWNRWCDEDDEESACEFPQLFLHQHE